VSTPGAAERTAESAQARVPPRGTDLLRWPVLGRILRARHARAVFQIPLLVLSIVLIVHGLFGPALAPKNLATVLVWVHYRGVLVFALLVAGNLFCMGCPFVLVRDVVRRWIKPRFNWPRGLRTKSRTRTNGQPMQNRLPATSSAKTRTPR
jgi:polyferredoxin